MFFGGGIDHILLVGGEQGRSHETQSVGFPACIAHARNYACACVYTCAAHGYVKTRVEDDYFHVRQVN